MARLWGTAAALARGRDEDRANQSRSCARRAGACAAGGCCNKGDCYPTEIRIVGGTIFAKRREDGKFIAVPTAKVERNRDNPDGRSHLCAPPPTATAHAPDTVFCFSLGLGM
jgi:hypothetical protein